MRMKVLLGLFVIIWSIRRILLLEFNLAYVYEEAFAWKRPNKWYFNHFSSDVLMLNESIHWQRGSISKTKICTCCVKCFPFLRAQSFLFLKNKSSNPFSAHPDNLLIRIYCAYLEGLFWQPKSSILSLFREKVFFSDFFSLLILIIY